MKQWTDPANPTGPDLRLTSLAPAIISSVDLKGNNRKDHCDLTSLSSGVEFGFCQFLLDSGRTKQGSPIVCQQKLLPNTNAFFSRVVFFRHSAMTLV